ncbi:uncharacterized protein BDZ99DRAFT_526473 [Mytilinidion resinicola]|uniref:AAA+ ATPase lid domain-containing protein n=1 Tax=Mytilinidion resinicola TaxID=574789 RepID=A0A6A6Y4V2_9PEZI|nr:uncharacterized protein BDZ99DRAFT_526473 [Mytilinidion resinicola]KAF2803548.1 hypothetical protein BDZ99DRAFT_526473 [Mytilinidion resinicola]
MHGQNWGPTGVPNSDRAALEVNVKEMDAPYNSLFHHEQELRRLAETNPDYKAVVCPLITFLEQHYRMEYDEAEDTFNQGLVSALHLGKLFKPSDIVVARHPQTGVVSVSLRGWCWGNDGKQLLRVPWISTVEMPPGAEATQVVPIAKLTIYPFRFASPEDQQQLRWRGKKYWRARESYYSEYTGRDADGQRSYARSRLMVDVSTYYQEHGIGFAADHEFDDDDPFTFNAQGKSRAQFGHDTRPLSILLFETEIDPQMLLVLPPTIVGFDMEEKSWVWLYVHNLADVIWNCDAFDWLVIGAERKELIRSLISTRATNGACFLDFVAGKGEGLTMLFHGPPGTVLLLDEADVFLDQRTGADLRRDSLVSVFLHALEYYNGIIILTTNRVGSRQLWSNLLERFKSLGEFADYDEIFNHLDELASEELNGRQIRNALTAAIRIAKSRMTRTRYVHLKGVIQSTSSFDQYLNIGPQDTGPSMLAQISRAIEVHNHDISEDKNL